MNVSITPMTLELINEFFKNFVTDPVLFEHYDLSYIYIYDYEKVKKYSQNLSNSDNKIEFAILSDGLVAGSIQLKHISIVDKSCEIGIHLTNDSYKNKGIGSIAEKLALDYAFEILKCNVVYANTLEQNIRSQRVLEKNGFSFLRYENGYKCYKIEK